MASQSCFIVTDKIFYAPAPANILTTDDFNVDLPYICGVLNSKLIYYAMREWYMGGGISGELKVNNLFKVPIPKRCDFKISSLALKAMDLNERLNGIKNGCEAEISSLKSEIEKISNEIDKEVFKIYELNDDEIGLITCKFFA